MNWIGTSVRWRIVLWIVATVLLALLAVTLTTRTILKSQVVAEANSSVELETNEFRNFVKQGTNPETSKPLADTRELIELYLARQMVGPDELLVGRAGKATMQIDLSAVTETYIPKDKENLSKVVNHVMESKEVSGVYHDPELGAVHWGRVDVVTDTKENGAFATLVFTAEAQRQVAEQTAIIAGVGAGGLAMTVLIAWLVAGQILVPIRNLRKVASGITDTDLTRRVPVAGNDEIAQLAITFNDMLDRLETAYQIQRQFVDDAGHELRTPITVIRGQLELLEVATEDQRDRSVALAITELDRMTRIVTDLLTLAIANSSDFITTSAVDTAELLIDIEEKALVMAIRDVVITSVAEGVVILDEQRVTQAMLELYNNAVSHTMPGDQIEMGSAFLNSGRDRLLRLWVKDHGPGIPEDKLPTLFDRFTRADGASRDTRTRNKHGAGLGLSIVRAIADAHNGCAWVESTINVGSTFGLDLPAPVIEHQSEQL
ncbi:MAG: ATP-binding protein [Corynebacterium sp.]|nr:ATP-binding protein [Corynebacterium sp.]